MKSLSPHKLYRGKIMLLFDRLKAFFFFKQKGVSKRDVLTSAFEMSVYSDLPLSTICSILSKLYHCSCSAFLSDSYTVLCSTWLKIQANPCLIGRCKQTLWTHSSVWNVILKTLWWSHHCQVVFLPQYCIFSGTRSIHETCGFLHHLPS